MFTYKKFLLLFCVVCSAFPLFSIDVVTLIDGSVINGEVTSYTSFGDISIRLENGAINSFPSSEVFSIEKADKIKVSLGGEADPYLYYVEGVRKLFQYVPPQYIYRGVSYNIDTDWGLNYEVGMFFSFLKQQHPHLDERTLSLIDNLDKEMIRQNRSMGIGGILIASGTLMTFLPLNFDDIQATPTYGKVISVSGFSLNLIGLSLMVYNAFIHQRRYPLLIAESFNEYISSNDRK